MASNLVFTVFLAFSSLAFVCFAEQIIGSNNGGSGASLPCVQKLLPCQASLVSHSKTPPSTCCIPLKQTIQDDAQCLCDVFKSPQILKGLNITQQDALNLAKYCQATVDLSLCKTADGPSPSSSPGSQAPPPPPSSSSSSMTSAAGSLQASVAEPKFIFLVLFLLLSIVRLI